MMKRTALVLALSLVWGAPASAGYEEGVAAYKRGDYDTAYREMKAMAEQGHAAAQNDLGFLYYQGQGVERDHRQAAKWYYKAAKQGYVAAQNNLAFLYENGEGVRYSEARARAWYLEAAEQGHAGAQFNVGLMYQNGRGGELDLVEAHKWFELAQSRLPKGKSRDAAERRLKMAERGMTVEQIAEAQRLARDWRAKHGKQSSLLGRATGDTA